MTAMADTKWAGLTLRQAVSQSTDRQQDGQNGSRRASESLRFVLRRSRVFTKIGLVEPIENKARRVPLSKRLKSGHGLDVRYESTRRGAEDTWVRVPREASRRL